MIDTTACQEGPEAMSDNHATQPVNVEPATVDDVLADSVARSILGDFRAANNEPMGEGLLIGWGWDINRQMAHDLLADPRLRITLAGNDPAGADHATSHQQQ